MKLQNYFDEFNENIRMDYSIKSELAEKRDILLSILTKSDDIPSFNRFNQGSYSMFTGVKPLDDEYDIDVGLKFNVNKDEYTPIELKEKIFNSLKSHTEYGAEIKNPCVTVYYKKDGEIAYHVDLAVYSKSPSFDFDNKYYLARGKSSSDEKDKIWEIAEPESLIKLINDKVSETDKRNQYRRMIRFMKRWVKLKCSDYCPPGIGVTLLVYEYFKGSEYDYLQRKFVPNDLDELISLVEKIVNRFTSEYSFDLKEYMHRLEYRLPVSPYKDVFCNMSASKQNKLYSKLITLKNDLLKVKEEADLYKQCEKLNKIFGDDFRIPDKEEVSEKQQSSISTSSASGHQ